MSESIIPQTGIVSDSTSAYIISIHQSYIESASILSLYLLSTQKSGKGITFTQAFIRFYKDLFRLFNVTSDIQILGQTLKERNQLDDWFSRSKGILDNLKTDRELVYGYANEGLKYGKEWISQLYNKQVITVLK